MIRAKALQLLQPSTVPPRGVIGQVYTVSAHHGIMITV